MLCPKYAVRENRNGYWTVYYIPTGEPIAIDGIVIDSLMHKQALLLLDLLNEDDMAHKIGVP